MKEVTGTKGFWLIKTIHEQIAEKTGYIPEPVSWDMYVKEGFCLHIEDQVNDIFLELPIKNVENVL